MEVTCYSGYRADERPTRFSTGAWSCEVREIRDRWYAPGADYFKVLGEDGVTYILKHQASGNRDGWFLVSSRLHR